MTDPQIMVRVEGLNILDHLHLPCECGELGTLHIITDLNGYGSCKGSKETASGHTPCNCHKFRPLRPRVTKRAEIAT